MTNPTRFLFLLLSAIATAAAAALMGEPIPARSALWVKKREEA